ncbi:MBL fold metallo-hydrolase [Roseomonas chloroacetimidivorans]|uniref:MBL fold metallo-hydrolase n=1 Tax=Roseomonas chloroacetimidivorans TaxID=1766656 RepID=UPI003C766BF0
MPGHEGVHHFPREIAPGILWFGNCLRITMGGEVFHSHLGVYLLKGNEKTLLVDTGMTRHWKSMRRQIDRALDGRSLDYVFPTHPEVPHCSNIPNLLDHYPGSRVVGDVRDYHLYYPEYADRFGEMGAGDVIDLGGQRVVFVPAVIRDLPSSLWAYEETRQVMFVADGFGFAHAGSDDPSRDDPLHRPGECALTSEEIIDGLQVGRGEFVVRAALYWSRFVDPAPLFAEMRDLLTAHPATIIAPAHGNVVVDVPRTLPIAQQTHANAFGGAFPSSAAVPVPRVL